jgi:hypothetical protein
MSVTEHERALAVMDDDGWGAAITSTPAYHEHWRPGQQLVKHRHATGHVPHEHAAAAPAIAAIMEEEDSRHEHWKPGQEHTAHSHAGGRTPHEHDPAVPAAPVTLHWYTSDSADDENHDQETNLDKIGNPGGAVWAEVSPNSQPGYGPWIWVIYDRWLDVDEEPDPTLADGPAASEEAAKAAVAEWIRAALTATKGK